MTKKWIAVRDGLPSKRQVLDIAEWAKSSLSFGSKYVEPSGLLPVSLKKRAVAELVASRLERVWLAAYSSGRKDGEDLVAEGTTDTVDAWAGDIDGFGDAMQAVGWLEVRGSEIVFPRFSELQRREYEPVPSDQRKREDLTKMTPEERLRHERRLAAARQANRRANKKSRPDSDEPAAIAGSTTSTSTGNVLKLAVSNSKPGLPSLPKSLVDGFCVAWNKHMPAAARGGPSHTCEPGAEAAAAAHRLLAEIGSMRRESGLPMPSAETDLHLYMDDFFELLAAGDFVAFTTQKHGAFVPPMLTQKVVRKACDAEKHRSAA